MFVGCKGEFCAKLHGIIFAAALQASLTSRLCCWFYIFKGHFSAHEWNLSMNHPGNLKLLLLPYALLKTFIKRQNSFPYHISYKIYSTQDMLFSWMDVFLYWICIQMIRLLTATQFPTSCTFFKYFSHNLNHMALAASLFIIFLSNT